MLKEVKVFLGHLSHSDDLLQLVVFRHRASCVNNCLLLLKNYKVNIYHCVTYLYSKRTVNCEIHSSNTSRKPHLGPNMQQNPNFQKCSSLLPHMLGTNKCIIIIHNFVGQENLDQNCKFHIPRVRGSDSRTWPNNSYIDNAFDV